MTKADIVSEIAKSTGVETVSYTHLRSASSTSCVDTSTRCGPRLRCASTAFPAAMRSVVFVDVYKRQPENIFFIDFVLQLSMPALE